MSLIFHIDMDAFFAAVEQHDNPELKGKPIVIGHDGPRGVVSTASYEARKYGIHSAMPCSRAKQLCPSAIFVNENFKRYQEVSKEIFLILQNFSPALYITSIDEGFLDMSGTKRLFGTPSESAILIKEKIYNATGLTLSIGAASNPYLAKLASDKNKPNGLTIIPNGGEIDFIDEYEIADLWGIGKKSAQIIQKRGLISPYQVRQTSKESLIQLFGNGLGEYLYAICHAKDPGILRINPSNRSLSQETTFDYDICEPNILYQKILFLSQQLFYRLHEKQEKGLTAFIKIRYSDFETVSIQQTLTTPIKTMKDFVSLVWELFMKKWNYGQPIRLIGVGLKNLIDETQMEQQDLFSADNKATEKVEKTVFDILKKGGNIKIASLLERPNND